MTNMTWTLSDDRETLTVTMAATQTKPARTVTFDRSTAPTLLFMLQQALLGWAVGE